MLYTHNYYSILCSRHLVSYVGYSREPPTVARLTTCAVLGFSSWYNQINFMHPEPIAMNIISRISLLPCRLKAVEQTCVLEVLSNTDCTYVNDKVWLHAHSWNANNKSWAQGLGQGLGAMHAHARHFDCSHQKVIQLTSYVARQHSTCVCRFTTEVIKTVKNN